MNNMPNIIKPKQQSAPTEPQQVEVTAPEAPEYKKKTPGLDWIFHALKYGLWPQFIQKYRVYRKWAKGNEDRQDLARKKLWTALAFCFGISFCWWIVFALSRGWSIHSTLDTLRFVLFVWIFGCIPMNIYCVGLKKQKGVFSIPDWTKLLNDHERLDWTEFPEPMQDKFAIGTAGKDWIGYGWIPPLYERTGYAVVGDLGKGRPNAINYLTACGFAKPHTIAFCLDLKPASGVGFKHLRGLKHIYIAEDFETIIKTVKWLSKILLSRIKKQSRTKELVDFPRILIVCDEEVSKTFLPGRFNERDRTMHYNLPAIHKELTHLLHNGHDCDMHIIAAIEPSETWLTLDNHSRPHFEEISFYYSLPRENAQGVIYFFKPHDNPYVDVFSIRVDGQKVVGKMPYISEKDLTRWIEIKSALANEATADLWADTIEKLPLESIGEKIEKDELIWVGGKLIRKSLIDSGTYTPDKPDQGPREEFYQNNFADKDMPTNGTNGNANGTNGRSAQQEELELQKN